MCFSFWFVRRVELIVISSRRKTRPDRGKGTTRSPKATDIGKRKDWPETKGMGRREDDTPLRLPLLERRRPVNGVLVRFCQ